MTTVRSTHRSLNQCSDVTLRSPVLSRGCPTSEHVGPKCLHWFLHADGIAVTASERTMGLPAVVLQSALQTATTQPSVNMRAGPQAHGRGLLQGCRGCLERLRCSYDGHDRCVTVTSSPPRNASAREVNFASKHGECSLHCAERGAGASPIDNRRCLRDLPSSAHRMAASHGGATSHERSSRITHHASSSAAEAASVQRRREPRVAVSAALRQPGRYVIGIECAQAHE